MKLQVLTMMTSASDLSVVTVWPAFCRRPSITSLSTRFFGHPRLINPILLTRVTPPKPSNVRLRDRSNQANPRLWGLWVPLEGGTRLGSRFGQLRSNNHGSFWSAATCPALYTDHDNCAPASR